LCASSAPSSLPSSGCQPQPPPRRAGGSSLHGRYGSDRDLSRPAPQRITAGGRQYGSKPVPAARQNQLERSPQELPVKDTDQSPVYDVVSAPRKFFAVCNRFMEQNSWEFMLSRNSMLFMEFVSSLPSSQEPSSRSYP
jgi:hypothetical protein